MPIFSEQIKTPLVVQHLSAWRSERRLCAAVSFEINPGEGLLILGQNGTGKSTLLRHIAGLLPFTHGRILWQGRPLEKCREIFNQQMVYVSDGVGVREQLTPHENLHAICHLAGVSPSTPIAQILDEVGLSNMTWQLTGHLSAGQKRRVSLARLRLLSAPLWLLDEPMTALDMEGMAWFQTILKQHLEQGGMVIMTSHQKINTSVGLKTLEIA